MSDVTVKRIDEIEYAGSSHLIVGVCDNDCADIDLSLEDEDGVVIASG